MRKYNTYKDKEKLIRCIVNTYFEALAKKHDSVEPRSLIKRGKNNKVYLSIDVFVSFILLVENAFFAMNKLHQMYIDNEFFMNNRNFASVFPSSTKYRIRREAIEDFLSLIGIFDKSFN